MRSVRDRVGDELFEAVRGDLVEGFVEVSVMSRVVLIEECPSRDCNSFGWWWHQ